jgi:hypothetical protein
VVCHCIALYEIKNDLEEVVTSIFMVKMNMDSKVSYKNFVVTYISTERSRQPRKSQFQNTD